MIGAAPLVLTHGPMAGAKSFEELVAWQLSVELREAVLAAIQGERVSRDREFCDQIRDSARSAPRNLAEGFDKFAPREFARYARIARGSLGETKNHILEGRAREYFSAAETETLLSLQRRSQIATTRLLAYLESCRGVAPTGWESKNRGG